jgi:hypothetical protein
LRALAPVYSAVLLCIVLRSLIDFTRLLPCLVCLAMHSTIKTPAEANQHYKRAALGRQG